MASSRRRFNFVGGKVDDDPLTISTTTLTSVGLSAFPTITNPDYIALVLDPDGVYGAPEVVWLTTHTGAATSGTILRAQESTTARAHPNDTFWVHAPLAIDFDYSEYAAKLYYAANFK